MESLGTIFSVFIGCLTATLVACLIVHFNGKTVISTIDLVSSLFNRVNKKNNYTVKKWLPIATEREVIILGLVPLAIASLISTSEGNCYHSIPSFLITEAVVFSLFCLNFKQANWNNNLFGRNFLSRNLVVFLLATLWCLVFSIWCFFSFNPAFNAGADRLIINGNADMWFYTRRFAGYNLDNVSFDNSPACAYLQISPKKFSSFIGSILVYFSPTTVFAITLFQGLLSCSLFLSLFGHWHNFIYNGKSLSFKAAILAILWGVTSPLIYWLLITSYASNILFIAIFVLGITAARNICLNRDRYPDFTEAIMLFSFVICVFSFYIVLLPVALFFYLITLIVYQYEQYLTPIYGIKTFAKLMLTAGIAILFCVIFFNHQIALKEVAGNLNIMEGHGKNFVPLNPWSLLQERLNPMPVRRDFGVWFNIVVGTIVSGFILKIIYTQLSILNNKNQSKTFYYKDLIAAALVIVAYVIYLFAYIPLDFTYRLGKFVVSLIYPLAILGLLPTILWYRDSYYHAKSRTFKLIGSGLITLHLVLHLSQMSLSVKPMGKYQLISTKNVNKIDSLTIIKCQKSDPSQKYQKIVGLDLAKQYPDLKINILTEDSAIANYPATDLILRGRDIEIEDDDNDDNIVCAFEIDI
ncbi:hypothetical protein I4641_06935 [Waterburya agarophytonicola K14]|uniref:Uncharacterized protein n=1 Tax=Waterburya agarophytonicola KI4 TaxID=2874699 RepID=A0A964FF90_9CYAN|nr:hypothetical protein [Waterburya agarophytonicola]MCC0176712.1 hypothetical protein [Waterburya agarophytonicola KI4]